MDEVALLEGLLQRYSPTFHEQEAVRFLVDWMGQSGYRAFVDEAGNAVGSRGDGPNEVVLLGHIDTVPGFIPVHTEGDLLYGRGSVDAKGPLACFAAAAARPQVLPAGWRFTVIGAVGEEGSSHGALYVRYRYHPQALIIGEPSKWDRITLGFKGSQWLNYTIRCTVTHTAGRAQSACELAVGFWNDLQQWCRSNTPEAAGPYYQVTPTLRQMSSETDGFYDTARLRIGLRLPPGFTLEDLHSRVAALQGEGDITWEEGIEAVKSEKNTFLVRGFMGAIRRAGGVPTFSLKTGTSDMNLVLPVWGCPAVAYGPGDSTLDHTPDEHISVGEYLRSIQVLADVLSGLTPL